MLGHPSTRWKCIAFCSLFVVSTSAFAQEQSTKVSQPVREAKQLSRQIDQLLLARMKQAKIQAAPRAGNAVWIRRLHLDLVGRIPKLLEVRAFLEDEETPNLREVWAERMLASDEYARHFSHVWRSILLPSKTDDSGNRIQYHPFELWLHDHMKANTRYDQLAKHMLTNTTNGAFRGSPAAFQTAHGAKPEELASATARVLLGVRLECAQCHAHPFAEWSREQFWQMAAFFDRNKNRDGRTTIPGTKRTVQPVFLDGKKPKNYNAGQGLQIMADWVTTKDNPWFAKAAVDHVWSYFFGLSLMEPIVNKEEHVVTHPKLLNLLAREFAAHNFDLKYLIRAIIYSEAYQRSSRSTAKTSDAHNQYFARMPVRSLAAEQLYDSFLVATHMKPDLPNEYQSSQVFNNGQGTPRSEFLDKFADQTHRTEKQTSILQALYLMNSQFLADRVNPAKNDILKVLATQPTADARRLESLYIVVLSRPPRPDEAKRLVPYLTRGGVSGDRGKALADIYWALLNSSEFMLNH